MATRKFTAFTGMILLLASAALTTALCVVLVLLALGGLWSG
jgi:hypothetical protein